MNGTQVQRLTSTRGSYAYWVPGDEPVLVDTSLPGRAEAMMQELDRWSAVVRHIVITHYDVDHIGNLAVLAERLGAEVWLPEGDVPYIVEGRPRPGIKRLVGALMRTPAPARYHVVRDGDQIGPVTAVASPGHTPGHLAYRASDALMVGDALRTTADGFRPSPAILSWNRAVESKSRQSLLRGYAGWVLPAHGEPLRWPREEHDDLG